MTVALITRESARNAFRGGITANQIITFLNLHAHPKVIFKKNIFFNESQSVFFCAKLNYLESFAINIFPSPQNTLLCAFDTCKI